MTRLLSLLFFIVLLYSTLSSATQIDCRKWFNDRNRHPLVSDDSSFKKWLETSGHQFAQDALALARRLTWEELKIISLYGGVNSIETTKGCLHKCIGCIAGCNQMTGSIRYMSWEQFTTTVRRIQGLQAFLKYIKSPYTFFTPRTYIAPYYQGDPMSSKFKTSDGNTLGITAAMEFLYDATGKQMYIWTAGWNPSDPVLEASATALVDDISHGITSYLDYLRYEVKVVTRPFINHVERYMRPIIEKDSTFQEEFSSDWRKHGFNFIKYRHPKEAHKAYSSLVLAHFSQIIASSTYMQDRIANIKLLLPVIDSDKVNIIFYRKLDDDPPSLNAITPFLNNAGKLIDEINRSLPTQIPSEKIDSRPWEVSFDFDSPLNIISHVEVIARTNGTIAFISATGGLFRSRLNNGNALSTVAHRPLFFEDGRELWQIAADRFDGANERHLSSEEKNSLIEHIKRIHPEFQRSTFKVRTNVSLKYRNDPAVILKIDGETFIFRFNDGSISKGLWHL